jgi:RIO kinase 1
VSQAIEDSHPNALIFLKRDCANVNAFFEKNGGDTITNQQLFELVSSYDYKETIPEFVQKYRDINKIRKEANPKFREIENGLFMNFEIPRTLKEEEVDKITENIDLEEALTKLCGVVHSNKDELLPREDADGDEDDSYENEESEDEGEDDEGEDGEDGEGKENKEKSDNVKKTNDPFEGLTKVERKKKVKEEKREKRQNKKLTKYEKQKIIKKTSGKRK